MMLVPAGVRVHIALGVSDVARRHGIAVRQLFRWKQELAPAAKTETTFLPVTITDAPERSAETPPSLPGSAPVIVERSAPGIEVELIGGRWATSPCGRGCRSRRRTADPVSAPVGSFGQGADQVQGFDDIARRGGSKVLTEDRLDGAGSIDTAEPSID